MKKEDKIFIAGHRGMVGSAILRKFEQEGFHNLITRTHRDLDLTDQGQVRSFFQEEQPDHVVLAAARVGGIKANSELPAEFIYQNLMIEANVIHQSWTAGVRRLLFLGSSCIYPKFANQPMEESELLTGTLEPTNEPYAIAKIAGIKLCESYSRQYGVDFRSVMPTNLYGPGDNFDLSGSHVVPALIRKFHEAKKEGRSSVEVWGSGNPRREFLHVDDMASACFFVLNLNEGSYKAHTESMLSHINVGAGKDMSIGELATLIAKIIGFEGEIRYDTSKPDGAPRKLLDVGRLERLGWKAQIELKEGLSKTYRWFLENKTVRGV